MFLDQLRLRLRLVTPRTRRAINITIPTMTLLLGGGAARLFWPTSQSDRDLTALVTKICTQQTDVRFAALEERLAVIRMHDDSTINALRTILCRWSPLAIVHQAGVQCQT